jgi:hypothetical protein
MTHRIRHQILELELPREAGAAALQQRAARVFQEQVLPRLEDAFDRIAPADRVWRIEQLDLDLGDISEANWERDFVEKCVAEISRQVAETVFELRPGDSAETLSAAENAVQRVLFFLENGYLPWQAQGLELQTLAADLLQHTAQFDGVFGREIRRVLREKSGATERLFRQFSVEFSEKLLAGALQITPEQMAKGMKKLQEYRFQTSSAAQRILLVRYLLELDAVAVKALFFEKDGLSMARTILNDLKQQKTNFFKPLETALEAAISAKKQEEKEEIPIAKDLKREIDAKKTAKPRTTQTVLPREGIPVEMAGLVLLGPYLPVFFNKLGLQLTAPEQQERAMHLLHYLATGREEAEEPLLVLPKILAGMPLESSVEQSANLNEEEKQEAERLLEAVIRNWPVLKNTRPDGLREVFLKRNGWFNQEEDSHAWLLQVERKGQDLLLEKISWSYSVIKLPWMERMLRVEW